MHENKIHCTSTVAWAVAEAANPESPSAKTGLDISSVSPCMRITCFIMPASSTALPEGIWGHHGAVHIRGCPSKFTLLPVAPSSSSVATQIVKAWSLLKGSACMQHVG